MGTCISQVVSNWLCIGQYDCVQCVQRFGRKFERGRLQEGHRLPGGCRGKLRQQLQAELPQSGRGYRGHGMRHSSSNRRVQRFRLRWHTHRHHRGLRLR